MKLIFMEYLASLKERGELDVIMPDLLSEIGFNVISRPAIGTRQYGVDVAAVGPGPDNTSRLYLLSIKSGNLRRSGWDTGEQSLRTSLNEILDVYITNHVPKRYSDLPVVIVLCLGGDLHEDVRTNVESFMTEHTKGSITFDLWNGDHLAKLLLRGILRENTLPSTWQSDFRKSLAMVDEPDVSFAHYRRFTISVVDRCKTNKRARLRAIRQIYLALWTLYVWARTADNIEAAYLCGEWAVLISWPLIKGHLTGRSKEVLQLNQSFKRIVELHNAVAYDYLITYVKPGAKIKNGLASAVPSQSYLDINLRMFNIIGRIGTRGLWQWFFLEQANLEDKNDDVKAIQADLMVTTELLADVIQNNPVLCTPIKDSHAIDINIACLLLNRLGYDPMVQSWIQNIASATVFAYRSNGHYPCVFNDYRDLIDHPKDDDQYRAEATVGSILVPTLAVWASINGDEETLVLLADFASGLYIHSTLQLWYPGSDTEEHLYRGSADHGLAATDIRIERCPEDMLAQIRSECSKSAAFESLSPLACSFWPLLILASRHHGIPVPPHFWPLTTHTNNP